MNFSIIAQFCFFLLVAAIFVAPQEIYPREAGWVPIEPLKGLKVPPSARERKISPPQKRVSPQKAGIGTVYDNQPPVTENELNNFVKLLPFFRDWTRRNGEEAHPVLTDGKPDFVYSQQAAQWVSQHDFEARRFFCIMGRMAAGVVIVEEGNDFKGTRPADMPSVSDQELGLVRKHLGELLSAGGPPPPIR